MLGFPMRLGPLALGQAVDRGGRVHHAELRQAPARKAEDGLDGSQATKLRGSNSPRGEWNHDEPWLVLS